MEKKPQRLLHDNYQGQIFPSTKIGIAKPFNEEIMKDTDVYMVPFQVRNTIQKRRISSKSHLH